MLVIGKVCILYVLFDVIVICEYLLLEYVSKF